MTNKILCIQVRTGITLGSMNRFPEPLFSLFLGIQRWRRHGFELKPLSARVILKDRSVSNTSKTIGSGLGKPYFAA